MKVNGTDLAMIRGDSESITLSLKEGNAVISFVTGDTVYFTVKRSPIVDEIALQKIVTEFHDGKALVDIFPADTKTLPIGRYVYDIQITFANGTVKTVVGPATLEIAAEVTYE